jgi:hypothetical protein
MAMLIGNTGLKIRLLREASLAAVFTSYAPLDATMTNTNIKTITATSIHTRGGTSGGT